MSSARWLGFALCASACYEVGDLRTPAPDASSSGGAGGGSSDASWADVAVDSAIDASEDASDANAIDASEDAPIDSAEDVIEDVASEPAPVGQWKSCQTLGYGGACMSGKTILYYDGPNDCGDPPSGQCVINRCEKTGGTCANEACSNGFACSPPLQNGQENYCTEWGVDGACIDNIAIRQDGTTTNCLFKDCGAYSATCSDTAKTPADCF